MTPNGMRSAHSSDAVVTANSRLAKLRECASAGIAGVPPYGVRLIDEDERRFSTPAI